MIARSNRSQQVRILLVEDNPGDVLLTQEALSEIKVPSHLSVVNDGEQALAFLMRKGDYEDAPRPDLILLDLNLPRKNGRDVLSIIKNDHDLKRIPVIVLTTSENETDIMQVYDLKGNCYVVKPFDLQDFFRTVKTLSEFWLGVAQLPEA